LRRAKEQNANNTKQTTTYTENIIKKGTEPEKETSNIGIVSVGAEN